MIWGISLRATDGHRKYMEGRGTRADAEAQVLAHYAATYPGRTYEVESASLLDPEALPCPWCGGVEISTASTTVTASGGRGRLRFMPTGTWTPQRERQYEHILVSCTDRGRPLATCKRIAAATVNKTRAVSGESATVGCHCPRGTRPMSSSRKCYDPSTRKRRDRRCVTPAKGQKRR